MIFGPNVSIYDHNHRFTENHVPIQKQGYVDEEVNIGSNVWVGANVVITAGSTIGDHVAIGANSVVTSNLESDSVYAGIPARLIKKI